MMDTYGSINGSFDGSSIEIPEIRALEEEEEIIEYTGSEDDEDWAKSEPDRKLGLVTSFSTVSRQSCTFALLFMVMVLFAGMKSDFQQLPSLFVSGFSSYRAGGGVGSVAVAVSIDGDGSDGDVSRLELVQRPPSSRSLLLLRNAESVLDPPMNDFDRPLTHLRGIYEANLVGDALAKLHVPKPDLILCCPSVRTRETLRIVLSRWLDVDDINNMTIPIEYEDQLLHQTPEVDRLGYVPFLQKRLQDFPNSNRVLVVGLTTMIQDLASYLTMEQTRHFPTCGFEEISLLLPSSNLDSWEDVIRPGGGKSQFFLDPRKQLNIPV